MRFRGRKVAWPRKMIFYRLINNFQVINAVEDWQDAQLTCRSIGADLASIHNERVFNLLYSCSLEFLRINCLRVKYIQENSFIRRLAVSQGAINGVFIGATVAGKGNKFGWIDGSEWDYENFYPGEQLISKLAKSALHEKEDPKE